ncbi:MAG: hypothetical protein ACK5T0_08500 [Vampirovibrionales bacterium]|jgi:hypothetical protein
MKSISSPLLPPHPYSPQAKVASSTNHARSGDLLLRGEIIKDSTAYVNTPFRIRNPNDFLDIFKVAFNPLLNSEIFDRYLHLFELYKNSEKDLELIRCQPVGTFPNEMLGAFYQDYSPKQNVLKEHVPNARPNTILSHIPDTEDPNKINGLRPKIQQDLNKAQKEYERRAEEEFPRVLQNLIDGKPAGIYHD